MDPDDDDPDKPTRLAVIRALGQLKDPSTIELVASRLLIPTDRHAGIKALQEFGPEAEREALKHVDDEDMWVRAAAIDVLGSIGGKESADALEVAADTDKEEWVQQKAKTAIRRMGGRAAG